MKKFILVVIIISLLALIGILFYFSILSNKTTNISECENTIPNPNEGKGYLPVGFSKYQCYTILAKSEEDISLCKIIEDAPMKESCYGAVAESKGDVSICEEISDNEIKNTCYLQVAYKNKDYSICDNFFTGQMRDGCRLGVQIRIANAE